jgi:uncharacterized membrane protein
MSAPSPSEQVLSQHGAVIGLTPQLLQEYNAAMPGSAEKLLNAAMEEITHRRELEKSQLDAEVSLMHDQSKEVFRGQIFAFLITLCFAGAGAYVILYLVAIRSPEPFSAE